MPSQAKAGEHGPPKHYQCTPNTTLAPSGIHAAPPNRPALVQVSQGSITDGKDKPAALTLSLEARWKEGRRHKDSKILAKDFHSKVLPTGSAAHWVGCSGHQKRPGRLRPIRGRKSKGRHVKPGKVWSLSLEGFILAQAHDRVTNTICNSFLKEDKYHANFIKKLRLTKWQAQYLLGISSGN